MNLRWITWRATIPGFVGILAMSAYFLCARVAFGIPTPSESFADKIAPFIPVHVFGIIIGLASGYTPLKILGFSSVIAAQFGVGILAGCWYVARARRSQRFLVLFATSAWLATMAVFATVVSTNYRGLPARPAVVATALSYAIGFALYAFVMAIVASQGLPDAKRAPAGAHPGRRSIVLGTLGGIVLAAGWGRLFARGSFAYDGRMYEGADVARITPIDRFYCVTKNVADPDVDEAVWRLQVYGAVETPESYTLERLQALDAVDQETTLMCINNPPGGGLMSNAVWRGVSMRALLLAARPRVGAVRVLMHAADSYVDTIPIEKAMMTSTLVAFGMNGDPLPREHGYPVRAIVPGWFGEKSVKWLRAIEVVTTPVEGFYERQGWGPNFHIPTHARFDAPDFSQTFSAASVVELRGVAFCGDRGVSRVEVSVDDGHSWLPARLQAPISKLVWSLWSYDWAPRRGGTYHLAVRAFDGNGKVQTAVDRGAETEGATGYHRVVATIG